MRKWYKAEFMTGGVSISFLRVPVYLDSSHKLSLSWSVSGLTVLNQLEDCEIRYAGADSVSLDGPGVLLPWKKLELGDAEVLVKGELKAYCRVSSSTSVTEWEKYRQDLDPADAIVFDCSVRTMLLLREPSLHEVEADLEWIGQNSSEGNINVKDIMPLRSLLQKKQRDLQYRSLFYSSVFDRLNKADKIKVKKALNGIYDDIMAAAD